MTVEDVNNASSSTESDILLAQLECPLDAVAEAPSGENLWPSVVLNPALADISSELLSSVDYYPQPIGTCFYRRNRCGTGHQEVVGLGVRNLIVTLGHHGAR